MADSRRHRDHVHRARRALRATSIRSPSCHPAVRRASALLALLLFGNDLGVIAIIGIVLLIGIVKKNAIMMIDFALAAERDEGKAPHDAIARPVCCGSARS